MSSLIDAQDGCLQMVGAERDIHFVQEEEVLAHMRP